MRLIGFAAALIVLVATAVISTVYFAPDTATRWFIGVDRLRAALERKEIGLPDGLRYVYLEGGHGEALMLLHGFGANKDSFNRVAAHLTSRYRVIVPDLIGFGESDRKPDADYSPLAQAERLRQLAHALGAGVLHLGGNSMGGQIALAYASRYPDEVRSLWLLDPAGVWTAPESDVGRIIRQEGRNLLLARSEADFTRTFEIVMSDPPYIPRFMLGVMAQERIRNFELEERIFGQITADSVEARAAAIRTPTLIVWGAQDRVLNVEGAQTLHRLMPQAQVIVMPEVGHMPMLERPRQSSADYLRFRASL